MWAQRPFLSISTLRVGPCARPSLKPQLHHAPKLLSRYTSMGCLRIWTASTRLLINMEYPLLKTPRKRMERALAASGLANSEELLASVFTPARIWEHTVKVEL